MNGIQRKFILQNKFRSYIFCKEEKKTEKRNRPMAPWLVSPSGSRRLGCFSCWNTVSPCSRWSTPAFYHLPCQKVPHTAIWWKINFIIWHKCGSKSLFIFLPWIIAKKIPHQKHAYSSVMIGDERVEKEIQTFSPNSENAFYWMKSKTDLGFLF